jgi:hypothetical protein
LQNFTLSGDFTADSLRRFAPSYLDGTPVVLQAKLATAKGLRTNGGIAGAVLALVGGLIFYRALRLIGTRRHQAFALTAVVLTLWEAGVALAAHTQHIRLGKYRVKVETARDQAKQHRSWVNDKTSELLAQAWQRGGLVKMKSTREWASLYNNILDYKLKMADHIDRWKAGLESVTPNPRCEAVKTLLALMLGHAAAMERAAVKIAQKPGDTLRVDRLLTRAAEEKAAFRALDKLLRSGSFELTRLQNRQDAVALLQSQIGDEELD